MRAFTVSVSRPLAVSLSRTSSRSLRVATSALSAWARWVSWYA